MIHINRKIYLGLEPKLQKEYIKDCIYQGYPDFTEDVDIITTNIYNILQRNEHIIKTYGWDSYVNEDYPTTDSCSGYSYTTGKFVVLPFDWSAETEEELDYSFLLAEII